MSGRKLRVPVKCPICSEEAIMELSELKVTAALTGFLPIRLYVHCHDKWWDANTNEVEQVREYMAALNPEAAAPNTDTDSPATIPPPRQGLVSIDADIDEMARKALDSARRLDEAKRKTSKPVIRKSENPSDRARSSDSGSNPS